MRCILQLDENVKELTGIDVTSRLSLHARVFQTTNYLYRHAVSARCRYKLEGIENSRRHTSHLETANMVALKHSKKVRGYIRTLDPVMAV